VVHDVRYTSQTIEIKKKTETRKSFVNIFIKLEQYYIKDSLLHN